MGNLYCANENSIDRKLNICLMPVILLLRNVLFIYRVSKLEAEEEREGGQWAGLRSKTELTTTVIQSQFRESTVFSVINVTFYVDV